MDSGLIVFTSCTSGGRQQVHYLDIRYQSTSSLRTQDSRGNHPSFPASVSNILASEDVLSSLRPVNPRFNALLGQCPTILSPRFGNSQQLSWRRASCSNRGTFGVCPRLKMGTKEYVVSILVKLDLYNFLKQIKRCFYVVGIPRKSFIFMFCLKKNCVYLIIYNFKRHVNPTQV